MSTSDSLTHDKSFEAQIGLYWLHRLGIVSLVLGFAFLIMYSFQYVGPAMKLLAGLAASLALIVTGEIMAKKDSSRWYGHGLTAGGWSLTYFTTYAAHFLPSVAVIDSMPVETALLIAVAAGSLTSALRANSEIMSIFSVTLASATMLLSGPGLFSNISFLIIAISASFLANRKSWTGLFVWSMIACYAGHFYCSASFWPTSTPLVPFFLAAMWLTFALGTGFAKSTVGRARDAHMVMTSFNAFALAGGLVLDHYMPDRTAIIMAGAGTLYLLITRWLYKVKDEELGTLNALLGLALLNWAKAIHYSGLSMLSLDVIQIVVLAIVGIKFNIRSFRWVALILGFLFVPLAAGSMSWEELRHYPYTQVDFGFRHFEHIKICLMAVSMLGALAFFCARYADTCLCDQTTTKRCGNSFYVIANFIFALVVMNCANQGWQVFGWGLASAVNHLLYVKLRKNIYSFIAFLALTFWTSQTYCYCFYDWLWLPSSLVVALAYAVYVYVSLSNADGDKTIESVRHLYMLYGTAILTLLLLKVIAAPYLSLSFGIEGLSLLIGGFLMRDRQFRIYGLIVMALVTGRLLFVDMAHYNTFGRIIAFIGTGMVFLIASYGYGRFTRIFEDGHAHSDEENDDISADGFEGSLPEQNDASPSENHLLTYDEPAEVCKKTPGTDQTGEAFCFQI